MLKFRFYCEVGDKRLFYISA